MDEVPTVDRQEEPDEDFLFEPATEWKCETAETPGELEVILNNLGSEGWTIWAVYDRLTQWVILAYQETMEMEDDDRTDA